MRTLGILVTAVAVAAAVLVVALPAAAGGGQEVIRTGNCSGSADWKLKLKLDDGLIETEFEVDQNVNGQRWRVVLRRDGARFFRGIRTTHAPSGSFDGRAPRREPRRPRPDHGPRREPPVRPGLPGGGDDLGPRSRPRRPLLAAGAVPGARFVHIRARDQ